MRSGLRRRTFTALAWLALAWPGGTGGALPDPESSDYLTVTEKTGTTPESFNHQMRLTRQVEIVGQTVVLDPNTTKNNLFTTYDNQEDIKTLTIYADTVVLRGRLRLPQTIVRIVTKNMHFENPGGQANGTQIVTTPRSLSTRPQPEGSGLNGAHGLRGGDVTIFWHEVSAAAGLTFPIATDSGNGQPAGLGRDGNDGSNLPTYNGQLNLPSINAWPANTVRIFQLEPDLSRRTIWGTNGWPGDGEDAVAAGRPGDGGDAGNFTFNHDPAFSAQMLGGTGGLAGFATTGGEPGEPINAVHTEYREVFGGGGNHYVERETHEAVAGDDAPPPPATKPFGLGGSMIDVGANEPYLHPRVLKAIDAYTADLFEAGALQSMILWIETYSSVYNAYKQTPNWVDLPQADKNAGDALQTQMLERRELALHNAAEGWRGYR
jgi:hypothetical protein